MDGVCVSVDRPKAIFERKANPLDYFGGEKEVWNELFREIVKLAPLTGNERVESAQVTALATHKAEIHWSPTASKLKAEDRFKIHRNETVDAENPADDANYRIFHLESVVNVREQNRTLELMAVERV